MIRNSARLIGKWNCYKPSVVQILQVRSQSEVPVTGGSPINPSTKPSIAEKKHPTKLEKRFIVWMGKYKTIDEVPDSVSVETLDKAKNKARIRIANYMMLITVGACAVMVYLGKKSAAEGNSVLGENLAWHQQMKEDYEKGVKK